VVHSPQNQLVDFPSAHNVEAWQAKAQQGMFLLRFAVSSSPDWDNCSKADW
jgi:hypothetical protein